MPTAPGARYCPLCERTTSAEVCAEHGLATIATAVVDAAADDDMVGRMLRGGYRVEGRVGEGAMGRVYVATQLSVGRRVAIKTLQRRFAGDARALRRFYQEARAASRLCGPYVVRVYELGVDDLSGSPFLVMEMVEGVSLAELIAREGGLEPRRCARLLGHVAGALVEAREAGVVHRDLKPQNVVVRAGPEGEIAKVVDFGVARILAPGEDDPQGLTAAGAAVGTPQYMAPEQLAGGAVDHRADLFSLGCLLHATLIGSPPGGHEEVRVLALRRLYEAAPALPERGAAGATLPEALRSLARRLLDVEPAARPAAETAAAVLGAVARGEDAGALELLEAELRAAWTTPPSARAEAGFASQLPETSAGEEPLEGAAATPAAPARRSSRPMLAIAGLTLALAAAAVLLARERAAIEPPRATAAEPTPARSERPQAVRPALPPPPRPEASTRPVREAQPAPPTPAATTPPNGRRRAGATPPVVRAPQGAEPAEPASPAPAPQPPPSPAARPELIEEPWEPL